jgi:hypothetical protein
METITFPFKIPARAVVSTWGTHTPVDKRKHLAGYVKQTKKQTNSMI